MSTRTRIKCSGCGKKISRSEPDLMLRKFGSEKSRFYHRGCVGAVLKLVTSAPDAWHMTDRYIDGAMN